jgi:hypothetical protein
MLVAVTYNLSYSGDRDPKGSRFKANSSMRPNLEKNLSQKKDWWSDSRCRP